MRTIRIVIMDAAGTVLDSVRTTVPEDATAIECQPVNKHGIKRDGFAELLIGTDTAKEPAGRW